MGWIDGTLVDVANQYLMNTVQIRRQGMHGELRRDSKAQRKVNKVGGRHGKGAKTVIGLGRGKMTIGKDCTHRCGLHREHVHAHLHIYIHAHITYQRHFVLVLSHQHEQIEIVHGGYQHLHSHLSVVYAMRISPLCARMHAGIVVASIQTGSAEQE